MYKSTTLNQMRLIHFRRVGSLNWINRLRDSAGFQPARGFAVREAGHVVLVPLFLLALFLFLKRSAWSVCVSTNLTVCSVLRSVSAPFFFFSFSPFLPFSLSFLLFNYMMVYTVLPLSLSLFLWITLCGLCGHTCSDNCATRGQKMKEKQQSKQKRVREEEWTKHMTYFRLRQTSFWVLILNKWVTVLVFHIFFTERDGWKANVNVESSKTIHTVISSAHCMRILKSNFHPTTTLCSLLT